MFDRSHLEALAAHEGTHPVVSLYLNLPPHMRDTPEGYRARLKNLLKQAEDRAPRADLDAITDFFNTEFDWTGQAVAVFSSQADDLWRVEPLHVPIRSTVHVGTKPYILPLAAVLDDYGSYTVGLVDQQGAQMYHFQMGELVDQGTARGEDIRRSKEQGGSHAAGVMRGPDHSAHTREMVRSNVRDAAAALEDFAARHKAEGILIGGTEAFVPQFSAELSQHWRDKLRGTFTVDRNPSQKQVRELSLDVLAAYQNKRERQLVEDIQTAAAKGTNGAVGMDDTLAATHAGRVQTLIVVAGVDSPGSRCENCGYLSTSILDVCTMCGEEMVRPVTSVVEHAVRAVVDQGGSVVFMDSEAKLKPEGGIASLLRY